MRLARDVGADAVHVSADVSATRNSANSTLAQACLEAGIHFDAHPGTTVVPPGRDRARNRRRPLQGVHAVLPALAGGAAPCCRADARSPGLAARGVDPGRVPELSEVASGPRSPDVMVGGASEARRRLDAWVEVVSGYEDVHDDLAADATSRLSPYLHFGCVSPLEVVQAVDGLAGSTAVRAPTLLA